MTFTPIDTRPVPAEGNSVLGSPRLSPAETDAMGQLRDLFEDRSWQQLHLHIASGGTFADDFELAVARVGQLGGSDQRLLRLFGLGLAIVDGGCSAMERTLFEALEAAGLIVREGGAIRTSGWVVAPAFGGQVLMGIPSTYSGAELVGALAYLGTDSLLLAKLLGPLGGRRVLDLGAGCGAQGLLAARGASEAVLTDIDPFSIRISALNWALNDVQHRVLLGLGDLYEPIAGETFDVIAVLPPYVPTVKDSGVSVTAAGGADGLAFIRRLLVDARTALRPGGELVALAQLLCDDDGPLLLQELPAIAPGLDAQLVLMDHHPLQPYLFELAQRLTRHGTSQQVSQLVARFDSSLRELGANSVCTAALRFRRPVIDSTDSGPHLVGPPNRLSSREVVALACGVTIAEPQASAVLRLPTGDARLLDPVTAALVGAIDGRRTIAQAADHAWGRPPGARQEQLAEQAIHRLGTLIREGLLKVATSTS